MGKNLISQARGKGSPRYRAPSFRYAGRVCHKSSDGSPLHQGRVIDLIHCQGHSSPLARIEYLDGDSCLAIAPEGLRLGELVQTGPEAAPTLGNTLPLRSIPIGLDVCNIEGIPGDGGKYVRASGVTARIVGKTDAGVIVKLPSKKEKAFHPECRAMIGIPSGSGRVDKPFLRAGTKYFKMKAKNKLWPQISGSAQNAVDHPFGNKRTSRKSKARPAPRHAGPGRKVGMIRPRRTGRKTGSSTAPENAAN
ncbi:50S ribosomal protein L2 [Candidatus Woesearchaeota archaeon]|nr:50S ribosomal protein L2 [Candidatus Woesearchaeota archaeon]